MTPCKHHEASSASAAGSCCSLNLSGDKDEGWSKMPRSVNRGSDGSGGRKKGAVVPGHSLEAGEHTTAYQEITGTNTWPSEEKRPMLLAAPIVSAD